MTDMEQSIYERASGHYKMKYGIEKFGSDNRPANAMGTIFKEFWTDYLSGKPIYKFQLREVS